MLAGLAVSIAFIASPREAVAQNKEWCTAESVNTRECYWDTWEQCRESKMHLMGGSCFRNPAFAGRPAGDSGFRPVPNLSAPYDAAPAQQPAPRRRVRRRQDNK